jgi:hypothetical protein
LKRNGTVLARNDAVLKSRDAVLARDGIEKAGSNSIIYAECMPFRGTLISVQ